MPSPNLLMFGMIAVLGIGSNADAETPWERYTAQPTSKNAAAVTELAYSDKRDDLRRKEYDHMLLEVQVTASDPEAVDLAFRLLRKSDGHVGEQLDEMLGRLIRINPLLFLKTLQRHRATVVRLDALVGNFGYAYVDRELAHAYERDQRVSSLLTVKDPALARLRDECVKLLLPNRN